VASLGITTELEGLGLEVAGLRVLAGDNVGQVESTRGKRLGDVGQGN
jgi:hypothetical protein